MHAFRNILCGIDVSSDEARVDGGSLSEASAAALGTALRVCKDDGAGLHLLTALDLDAVAGWVLEREKGAGRPTVVLHAEQRLEQLVAPVRAAGLSATTAVSLAGPAAALLDDAKTAGRDLVVVGTRERGAVARLLLGSTALTLLRRAPVPVWIARNVHGAKPATVLAVVDLGDMASRIVGAAAALAANTQGTLHVLHVVDFAAGDVLRRGAADEQIVREYRKRKRDRSEAEIPAIVANAVGPDLPKPRIHLPDGNVAETILQRAADLKADVVVMGSVVHSVAGAAFTGLGRTAEAVVPHLAASVLVLKP